MKIIMFFLLFCLSMFAGAQQSINNIHINCCGINQIIPVFKKDTGKGFSLPYYSYWDLLRLNYLSPITQSKAKFEIRYWIDAYGHQMLIDISGVHNSVVVKRYDVRNGYKGDTSFQYRDIGSLVTHIFTDSEINQITKGDSAISQMIKKNQDSLRIFLHENSQFTLNESWNSFFNDLIKCHLFDMPDQQILDSIINKDNPHSDIWGSPNGGGYIEIKIGKYYRGIWIAAKDYFSPVPDSIVPFILARGFLFKKFRQFYHDLYQIE